MQQLPTYRNDEAMWQELAYSASTAKTKEVYDYNYDKNAKARYSLLIELQYDLKKKTRI